MTARRTVPLGLAACALVAATPAWSHPVEAPGEYEYAQPAPAEPPVVYQPGEVVQDVPGDHGPHGDHAARHDSDHHADAPVQPDHDHHGDVPVQPERYHHAMPAHSYPRYAAPPQPGFDHAAWLAECRARLGDGRARDEDGVGGGVLGAIVGGVIGNRVASGERLAGTLIGAGVGGLAGIAIGTAIGAAARDRDDDRIIDECEAYLDDYLARGYPQPGYGPGYGYGYGAPVHMTYVPVLVMVPQRAVIRETVTEEWVEGSARPARRTIERHHPPQPAATKVKRIRK